jgi:hypothetical protein
MSIPSWNDSTEEKMQRVQYKKWFFDNKIDYTSTTLL